MKYCRRVFIFLQECRFSFSRQNSRKKPKGMPVPRYLPSICHPPQETGGREKKKRPFSARIALKIINV